MNTYKFDELKIGMKEEFIVSITDDMIKSFCSITGDVNPLHTNIEYANSKGYKEPLVYGMLISSFLSTLVGVYLPGKYAIMHNINILFKKPVFVSDSPLTIKGIIVEKNEIFKQITINFSITNNKNIKVSRGYIKVGVLDE